ncbi:hypothetical protein JVT61DRAFT_11312 [Boletus reticuloceps]|uniref:Uncharacterized protein n=1 Tax=Boletus reticuloceps TaxID=495285 RepID=A0A8I2YEY3_9AGAM|nr:hypothetical protein JVT61DRAFT_11312 [Boletus reticuloceps]
MVFLALPPTMDSPEDVCFCGRKTVKSHDFLFCSTKCARRDSLRSLGDTNSHYRNVVHNAYIRAGAPELQPHRMMSTGHLRHGPSEQHGYVNAPAPFFPQTSSPHRYNVPGQNLAGIPMSPQVSGVAFSGNATAGESLVAGSRDWSRREDFQNVPSTAYPTHHNEQISLGAIPFPENVPTRSLRHVRSSIERRSNSKKSQFAALLGFGRFRKGKEVENHERVFGHPVDTMAAPVRNDPRRLGRAL